MNDITKKPEAGLPANFINQLLGGIAESRASTPLTGGGKDILRLQKSGTWVYGAENIDVQDGSQWAVNIMSLQHGWVCWVEGQGNNKNSLQGEVMASMTQPKPLKPEAIDDTDYKEQRSFELKCLTGEDAGKEVIYKINSDGGMRAVDALLAEIQKQLATNPAFPCPVVEMSQSSYTHTKWGQIFKPIFTVVGWVDMNGSGPDDAPRPVAPPPTPAAAAKPNPAPAPAKPRKPSLKAVEPTPAPAAPVSTTQAHVGQRRRTRA